MPGRLKLHFTAIPVLVGLLLTMMILAAVEKAVLDGLFAAVSFLAASIAAAAALRAGNRRFYRTSGSLRYDEEPEAALIQLGPAG